VSLHTGEAVAKVDDRHPQEQGLKPEWLAVKVHGEEMSTTVIHKNKD